MDLRDTTSMKKNTARISGGKTSFKASLLIITLLFLFALFTILISDKFLQNQLTKNNQEITYNNERITEINEVINRYRSDFYTFFRSTEEKDYHLFTEDATLLSEKIAAMQTIFEQDTTLLLYSRIIDQVNDYIAETTEYQLYQKEPITQFFSIMKTLEIAFTELTSSWNTLINGYMEYNNKKLATLNQKFSYQKNLQLLGSVIFSILIFLIFSIFLIHFRKRLNMLTDMAENLSNQNWEVKDLEMSHYEEFAMVSQAFNQMKNQIIVDIEQLQKNLEIEKDLRVKTLENEKQKYVIQEARFRLLQAQIQPHFLFNTLNMIIRTIQEDDNELAILLIKATSDLLRNSISIKEKTIPLFLELELLQDYLTIVKERYTGRLTFILNYHDGELTTMIPPFILQPLVENSIKHGMSETTENGLIRLDVFSDEDGGVFLIQKDNGKGASQEKLTAILKGNKHLGNGLQNIISRLHSFYNNEDLIEIKSLPENGFEIKIHINSRYSHDNSNHS